MKENITSKKKQFWLKLIRTVIRYFKSKQTAVQAKVNSKSPFPRPMALRVAPISVSIALGHVSANAVKATAGGWSTGSSASLTFPLHPFLYVQ